LAIITSCFAIEVIVGVFPQRKKTLSSPDSRTVIVVPANNEEVIIADTIAGIALAAHGMAKILVVADNCTDGTARRAAEQSVEVIERDDRERRGKGFALDFSREHLRADPPDVVVVLDADCTIERPSLDKLIRSCALSQRPCQGAYLQSPKLHNSPVVQLSTFAFFVKNMLRQRALQRLAGRVHLLGTGMAFPWQAFNAVPLATASIVEDLKMGLDLADAGYPPLFIDDAVIWSSPEDERNTLRQRQRWEGGFLQVALLTAPATFRRSIGKFDISSVWAALNLVIPPLGMLILIDATCLMVSGSVLWLLDLNEVPLVPLAAAMILSVAALCLAWSCGGHRFVTARALARVPTYLIWKLPMYVGFARSGAPRDWIRTRGPE
jgi:cellulose synthase/poly-beta-1,6-N-acetylglucosamine synthase-like glycosyltransferase